MIFGTPSEQSRLGNTTFVAADIEPLELIRDAMRKLKGAAIVNEGGAETADGLQEAMDALQIFEERILHHNSNNNVSNNTSNAEAWTGKGQAAGEPFSPINKENSVPNTPVTDKVRMQLENAVAELTERLEVVEEERDEQADLAKALQQDLESKDLLLEEQKEELKLHKQICDELTSQLSDSITTGGGSPTPKKEDRQASPSSPSQQQLLQQQQRESTPSSEDAKNSRDVLKVYMENQLDLQASEQSEYEQMTDVLLSKLEGVEAELASRDEELAKMTTELASLTAENTRLADELLEAQEELEEQEGVEARLKGRMLELESCILQVRGTDEVLTSDVSMNIMDLSEKLSEERERCRLLQNMVTNLKESSADTDELLVVLKEDKEELEVDFECLNKDFEEQVQELANATEEVTRLSLELRESVDKEREATAKRNQLEEDLASLKVQIGTYSAEVSEVEDKRREMNALLEEKRALGQEIREQAREIERKEEQLRVKEEELERSKGEFARTKEALQEALDEVEKESSQRSELMKELQGLLLLRHSSPGSVDNSLVTDEDSPLNMSGFSNWGGGGSPDNSMMSVSGLQQQGGQQGGQNNADIEVLHEKLENAEKRAAEAMQSDVEHLTKNAILDGECSRLRQMTSELKETNSKLEGDVQTAKKEAARYKALEKTAKKLKADLSKTKAALDEASMFKRDQEQQAQFQESELVAKFESESEELQDRVKLLETELQESRERISNSAQAAQEQDEQIRLLMEQRDEYQREVSSLESECEGAMASSEEVKEELEQGKKELQDVREELRSTQERLADASAKMARDNQEFSSRLEAAAATKVKLERDISTMNMGQSSLADQLKDIEAHSEAVQKQLRETTDSLALSSKQKEELTRRITEADVELAKRYTRIEKLSDEVDEWESRFEDFKQTEHKLLQETHRALQSDMEALKTELTAASRTLSDTQRELDSARGQQSELSSKYQVLDGAFTELQEKDLHEREVRVRELQTELQQKLHDQEALEEQLAELTRQLQQSQKDNEEIRDAEESRKRLLDELDQRMSVVEDEKRKAVAELNQRVQREGQISGEISSIKDSLASCLSISASNINAPLSPTPAAAAASLLALGSSSSSSDLAASVEHLRTYSFCYTIVLPFFSCL
jgi:chromosome segregation ATPase